ncbi:murein biosynthesis integral membrane protein MurJ [Magnetococcales bacterium HHB-1]
MAAKDINRLIRAAGTIGSFTLLSRILGFVRDIVIARSLGAGLGSDAFFVAQKLPNFLRRLFAEGAFNTAFVPVFSDYVVKKNTQANREMVQAVFTILAMVTAGIVLLAELFMPILIAVVAPGFMENPEKFQLTVDLTRITFPYIFFISLVALAGGILNSFRQFSLPAATPILLNISIILSALLLSSQFDQPATALAVGIFLGGVVQLLIQRPALKRVGTPFSFRWQPKHPAVIKILRLMGPSILGVSAMQIGLLFDIFLASWLPEGSVSFLYYADRLVEFPLGLIAIAMGTAVLPGYSAKASLGDIQGMQQDMDYALRMIIIITLPATIGLMVLAEPILALLFERGAFTAETTFLTAQALWAYSIGLIAFSAIKVVAPAFYALKDTKTPVKATLIALAANMILNVILMFPLKHAGLALATALAAMINVSLLLHWFRKKTDFTLQKTFWRMTIKSLLASIIMGLLLFLALQQGLFQSASGLMQGLRLFTGISLAVLLYFAIGYLLRLEELHLLLSAFRKKAVTK